MFSAEFNKDNIRAVFFDFDGTLRFNKPLAHHFFFDHAVSLGAADSIENRRSALHWAHTYWNGSGEVVLDSDRFGYDTDEFWLNYATKNLQAFNCTEAQSRRLAPELRSHMREKYEFEHVIEQETPEILDRLRQKGLLLAVISNRDEPYDELLQSLDLSRHFNYTLAAGEVNSWKPDPKIFEHALATTGIKASETVYVGDNYFADVVGARRAGIEPVLIDPEHVFPKADCAVIRSITDLWELLG